VWWLFEQLGCRSARADAEMLALARFANEIAPRGLPAPVAF
jgi:hypothetical protein